MEIKEIQPENILLIWLGKIGDFVVSTPFIKAVRDKYPHSHIGMMVRTPVEKLAVLVSDVDEIITFPKGYKSFAGLPEFLSQFLLRDWNLCIDLNPSYSGSSGRMTRFSGAKYRVGFSNPKAAKYYNYTVAQAGNEEHMMHRYDRLAELLGLKFNHRMHLDTRVQDLLTADKILKDIGIERDFIIFHPGNFKKDYSCWPKENFIRLSKDIHKLHPDIQQVYLAGPDEEDIVAGMVEKLDGVAVQAPSMSLPVTAAFLSRGILAVDNSTGTLHMAEAVGTPTLSFHKEYSYLCWRPLETKGAALSSGDWHTVHPLSYEKVWDAFLDISLTI